MIDRKMDVVERPSFDLLGIENPLDPLQLDQMRFAHLHLLMIELGPTDSRASFRTRADARRISERRPKGAMLT
jgi:hypothetical protein